MTTQTQLLRDALQTIKDLTHDRLFTAEWASKHGATVAKLEAALAQPAEGGEVVKSLFAAKVAARKWADLQSDGHRMQSIVFDGGKGGPGTIDPWGVVRWGATPKLQPMTYEQRQSAFLSAPTSSGGHRTAFMLGIQFSEAHHGIAAQAKKETP